MEWNRDSTCRRGEEDVVFDEESFCRSTQSMEKRSMVWSNRATRDVWISFFFALLGDGGREFSLVVRRFTHMERHKRASGECGERGV